MVVWKFLKTVFSGAAHLLALLLKIVYNILRLFKVRALALWLLVCGALQLLFRTFSGGAVWFWAGFALCCLLTAFGWFRFFTRRRALRRREPEKAAQTPPQAENRTAPQKKERAHYYNVEGRDGYYFAEYEDRYELFRVREGGGAELVRTDYKTVPKTE